MTITLPELEEVMEGRVVRLALRKKTEKEPHNAKTVNLLPHTACLYSTSVYYADVIPTAKEVQAHVPPLPSALTLPRSRRLSSTT